MVPSGGNNPAFVTAAESLEFWRDDSLKNNIQAREKELHDYLGVTG